MTFSLYLIPILVLFGIDLFFDITWFHEKHEWLIIIVIVWTARFFMSVATDIHGVFHLRLDYLETCLKCEHFYKDDELYFSTVGLATKERESIRKGE